MKEKLLKNLGLKILSLVLAAMFWIVIMNVEDPPTNKRFSSVPVEILNADSIDDLDKVYEVVSGDKVDIIIQGKASVVRKLQPSDFKVTANLNDLTQPWDSVKINVSCPKYDHLSSSQLEYKLGKVSVLKVTVEDKVSANFPVQVETIGKVMDGYTIGSKKATPIMLEVSGGRSQIEKIDKVQVSVNIAGTSETITEKVVPVAYDGAGNPLDSSKLLFSKSEVSVTVSLLETKVVPLVIKAEGRPMDGYSAVKTEYQPVEIEIAGSSDRLKDVNSIDIPVNLSGRSSNLELEVEIGDHLPEGIELATDKTPTVFISVQIEKMEVREYTLTTSQIAMLNIPEQYKINYQTVNNNNLVVRVMGDKEAMGQFSISDISASIDLKDLEAGMHTLDVKIETPGNITVLSAPSMTIELVEETVDLPSASPLPTEEPLPSLSPEPEETPEPMESPVPAETPGPAEENGGDGPEEPVQEEPEPTS